MGPDDLQVVLQRELGYRVRKTVAHYIDEFNWCIVVGANPARRATK